MRLLLAEDDPQIGAALVRAFARAGLQTEWVHRGDTADTMLTAGGFDAAVLDIGLPGRDGLDVQVRCFGAARRRRRRERRVDGRRDLRLCG